MIYIFDLDETLIDSRHRLSYLADGSLDLVHYRAVSHTRANVMNDTLLPLAHVCRALYERGEIVIALTARHMADFDYDYLKAHNLNFSYILSRNDITKKHYNMPDGSYKLRHIKKAGIDLNNAIMFDDNASVKTELRLIGLPVICAIKLNQRLRKAA